MAETDVLALHTALITRLGLATLLAGDKAFNEDEVPRGAPMPYAVLGAVSSGRDGANRYGQPGHLTNVMIRWWATNRVRAMLCFQQGCTLLDGYRLTLDGHVWERGRLVWITNFSEPDPEIGGYVVASQYRCRTSVVA